MAGLSPKKSRKSILKVPVVLITGLGNPIRAAEPEIPGGRSGLAQTGQLPTTGRRHRAVLERHRQPAINRRRARHRLQLIRMSAADRHYFQNNITEWSREISPETLTLCGDNTLPSVI